jgi:2-dehydro-3-deoxygluconokinase
MNGLGAVGEGLAELRVAPVGAPALSPGGDVANVAVMSARFGAPSRLAGRVGEDRLGRYLLDSWERAGLDLRHLRRDRDAPTGLYVSEPMPDGGHRYSYWRRGSAGSRLEPRDIEAAFFSGLGVLVVSGVTLAISSSAATDGHRTSATRTGGAPRGRGSSPRRPPGAPRRSPPPRSRSPADAGGRPR